MPGYVPKSSTSIVIPPSIHVYSIGVFLGNPYSLLRVIITTSILSTSSIGVGSVVNHCWNISYLLCQICGHGIYGWYLYSCFPLNLSSSFLLSLQYLSKLVVYSYHCSILVRDLFAFINFLLIAPLISLLNSFINSLSSYLLSLAALQNSYTNSSIVLPPCSNFFNSATFTNSSSSSPNSLFIVTKNSPTDSYSNNPSSRSSNIFSFQMSADPFYTYDSTYWICSSTITSLILILIYSLQAVKNSDTFPASSLKTSDLATFLWTPSISLSTAAPPTINACICVCIYHKLHSACISTPSKPIFTN